MNSDPVYYVPGEILFLSTPSLIPISLAFKARGISPVGPDPAGGFWDDLTHGGVARDSSESEQESLEEALRSFVKQVLGRELDQDKVESLLFKTDIRQPLLARIQLDEGEDAKKVMDDLNRAMWLNLEGLLASQIRGIFFRHSMADGAQHVAVGGGGPGRLLHLIPEGQEPRENAWKFYTENSNLKPVLETGKHESEPLVFILDTIPKYDDLKKGFANLNRYDKPMHNELLQSLAAAHRGGKLQFHYATGVAYESPGMEVLGQTPVTQLNMCNDKGDVYVFDNYNPGTLTCLADLDYFCDPAKGNPCAQDLAGCNSNGTYLDFSDHGLFVAGIIRSLAPNAEIHMIEVLNKQCLGRMWGYAHGIRKMLDIIPTINAIGQRPVVVNSSLLFASPDEVRWEALSELLTEVFGLSGENLEESMKNILSNLPELIFSWFVDGEKPNAEAILEELGFMGFVSLMVEATAFAISLPDQGEYEPQGRYKNHVWVAAAGNEADVGKERPPTAYPARAPVVIGVGALDKRDQPASYSNIADPQNKNGVWAFGGDYGDECCQFSCTSEGILGISLKSETGFARWAGTSFAAAVVSGTIALLLSQGKDVNWTEKDSNLEPYLDNVDGIYKLRMYQP